MFDLIATVLAWFYQLVPNYAVAIAMLTVLIMLLLTPLTLKSTKSMLELQRIQPEMKRIQQAHKGDRQAMNEELMALYKEHKVNPLGGCLPLLIQAPIWIVMFRVLRGITYKSAESKPFFAPKYLDHSTQLYQDLSHSTQMRAFGLDLANSAAQALQDTFVKALPYLILVAIVVITYFVQQRQITARNKNNPTINDNPAAAQQQMIMKIFPIFSGVFAFIVPAALAWYFLVQNVFRIGQQAYITKRFYKEHPDAIAARQASTPKATQNRSKTRPSRHRRAAAVATPSPRPRRRHRPRRWSRRASPSRHRRHRATASGGRPPSPRPGRRGARRSHRHGRAPAEEEALTRRSEEATPWSGWRRPVGRPKKPRITRSTSWAWTRATPSSRSWRSRGPDCSAASGVRRACEPGYARPRRVRRSSAGTAGIGAAGQVPLVRDRHDTEQWR